MQRKVIAMVLLAIITLLPGCLSSKNLDKWAAKYGFSQREVLPLTIEDQGLPRVNVEINEQEVKMLFDTGNVVGTQISPRRANKLNLPQINNWQSGEETAKAGETFRVFRAKDFIFAGIIKADQWML